jgi:cytochrome oxidase Cu insertion factor (SCO1/SenC/PrrC family)
MRRLTLATPLVLLLMTVLYGCQWTSSRKVTNAQQQQQQEPLHPGIEVGQLAPDIEGTDLNGQYLHLADYRGQVVVLSFWSKS